MTRALRFLPPIAWTGLIAWLSSPGWSAAKTGSRLLPLLAWLAPWLFPEQIEAVHWLIRKSAHAVEYGVLAGLWYWALDAWVGRRRWLVPLGLAVLTGALDEIHQSMTSTRGGSALDVLLDSSAAAAALAVVHGGIGQAIALVTVALLWIAAAGGAVMIAIDVTAGAPAGWLWWSVPAAWLALFLWYRAPRR
jgi:VanZ family protein